MDAAAALSMADDLPRYEAERLLLAAGGLRRGDLIVSGPLDGSTVERFLELVDRRRRREPLQYLEGTVSFGPLELAVDERALIPRPETEQLWELVIRLVDAAPAAVVDLCAGSGNLALACKHAWPGAAVYATEVSPDAVDLARENVARTGLDITVLEGDLFSPLPGELEGFVDVIVANPPYLAASEIDGLDPEVRDHEPRGALVAGEAGTEVLSRIAAEAARWLRAGGLIACEISELHPEETASLFAVYQAEILPDLTGRPRFVAGRRSVS